MYMSSFLCFCFYENLQELNGVRTRMNIGRDEFLFLKAKRRRICLYLLLRDDWFVGELILVIGLVNSKQIIEVDRADGSSMA